MLVENHNQNKYMKNFFVCPKVWTPAVSWIVNHSMSQQHTAGTFPVVFFSIVAYLYARLLFSDSGLGTVYVGHSNFVLS